MNHFLSDRGEYKNNGNHHLGTSLLVESNFNPESSRNKPKDSLAHWEFFFLNFTFKKHTQNLPTKNNLYLTQPKDGPIRGWPLAEQILFRKQAANPWPGVSFYIYSQNKSNSLVFFQSKTRWWLNQPIWKILVKLDHFLRDRGENQKKLELPPPRKGDLQKIHPWHLYRLAELCSILLIDGLQS